MHLETADSRRGGLEKSSMPVDGDLSCLRLRDYGRYGERATVIHACTARHRHIMRVHLYRRSETRRKGNRRRDICFHGRKHVNYARELWSGVDSNRRDCTIAKHGSLRFGK